MVVIDFRHLVTLMPSPFQFTHLRLYVCVCLFLSLHSLSAFFDNLHFTDSPPAMGHRKLLHAEAPFANPPANQTDPCPYGCPVVYASPPPPALPYWPPPPPVLPQDDGSGSTRFTPAVIFVVAFLGGVFLLVSYYVVIAKTCLVRRRRSRSRGPTPLDGGGGGGGGEELVEENRVDHPIWHIRTVGLSPAAIGSIAVCEYRKGEGLVEGSDCTVCLTEFRDGETLRVLPKCGHAFHVPCIDTWLRSHTNCPLCRAAIVGPIPLPLPPPELLAQPLDGDDDRAVGAVVSGGENTDGAGAQEGVESGESNGDGLLKETGEVNGQDGQLGLVEEEAEEEEEGVVPVRRSVSMDSPFVVIEPRRDSEPRSSDVSTSGSSTIGDSSADRANTSSHSAARSLSWSGRLFMPRHNNNSRASSNSTPPQ